MAKPKKPAISKKAECIRTVANWSKVEKSHIFDQPGFRPSAVEEAMEKTSPKLVALFKNIEELDAADKASDGKMYKHMIFTDVRQAQYGVKILAAAFAAKGYKHLYTRKMEMADKKDLKMGHNFATLCSTTIYGKPMPVRFRKRILEMFNERPENVHGENVRFLLLDRGFKEGIDLFDVKYVHLFEPLVSTSDEKQAIGRATRFCGQKGLPFAPKRGWDLYVYHYEVSIPEELQDKMDATRMFKLYLNHSGLDLRRLVFASTLEKTTMLGAVDFTLTRNIHDPNRDHGSNEYNTLFDPKPLRPRPPSKEKPMNIFDRSKLSRWNRMNGPLFTPKVPKKLKKSGGAKQKRPMAPRVKMSAAKMREYIDERFHRYEWPPIKLENLCETADGGAAVPEIVKFTPTQEFVRNYFNPSSVYKGLLLYHGVGVGKTCSAMAIASTSFERQGYTILWVTRHTLKADIWKNMFRQVCSLTIREKIENGEEIPEEALVRPRKHLPPNWMEPISYKQFSNLLEGKNDLYRVMVERNGEEDPLKKTLIILDEAHKLYAPDLLASERPNVETLRERIYHSYDVSGKDSCKVLLMSATPFNTDPMEMIKLMNLMRLKDDALPEKFEEFEEKYLDSDGTGIFTEAGRERYMNDIAGYVSYLNREKDARQFAIPQFHNVIVPMTRSMAPQLRAQLEEFEERMENIDGDLNIGKGALVEVKARVKADREAKLRECDNAPRGKKVECKKKVREDMKEFQEKLMLELKTKMENAKEEKKQIKKESKVIAKQLKDVKKDPSQEAQLEARCKV